MLVTSSVAVPVQPMEIRTAIGSPWRTGLRTASAHSRMRPHTMAQSPSLNFPLRLRSAAESMQTEGKCDFREPEENALVGEMASGDMSASWRLSPSPS